MTQAVTCRGGTSVRPDNRSYVPGAEPEGWFGVKLAMSIVQGQRSVDSLVSRQCVSPEGMLFVTEQHVAGGEVSSLPDGVASDDGEGRSAGEQATCTAWHGTRWAGTQPVTGSDHGGPSGRMKILDGE